MTDLVHKEKLHAQGCVNQSTSQPLSEKSTALDIILGDDHVDSADESDPV